jgi:hypothetical protein
VAVTLCIVSSLDETGVISGIAGFLLLCFWGRRLLNAVFGATEETKIENELAAGLKKV